MERVRTVISEDTGGPCFQLQTYAEGGGSRPISLDPKKPMRRIEESWGQSHCFICHKLGPTLWLSQWLPQPSLMTKWLRHVLQLLHVTLSWPLSPLIRKEREKFNVQWLKKNHKSCIYLSDFPASEVGKALQWNGEDIGGPMDGESLWSWNHFFAPWNTQEGRVGMFSVDT